MKAIFSTYPVLFIASLIYLQFYQSDIDRTTPVAKISSSTITIGELIDNYRINQNDDEITTEELIEFLPSYVEYRLKLKKGLREGFHYHPDILGELEHYGRQAAEIYWLENKLKEQIIRQYKERSRYELKAFHILIEVPEGSSTYEENEVYQRLLEAREQLADGTDPNEVNENFSSIRNGNYMGGSLPWITAGRTVQPFEDALFSLETGEISQPVRTQFGYHLIYLHEKRERLPDRQVRHLFFQDTDDQAAEEAVEEAFLSLQSGMPWNEAVETFSMDRSAANRGGLIGWVGYAMQFPEPFVDAVMQADLDLPYSEPLAMPYGYHIIRIDSVRTYPSDEIYNQEIVGELERLQRLNPNQADIIEALKIKGNFQKYEEVTDWPSGEDEQRLIFSFRGDNYTTGDLLAFSDSDATVTEFRTALEEFENEIVLSHLIDMTRKTFPDFDSQLENFLNGLVVFRVNEEFIWNEEAADRESLKEFYSANMDKYHFQRTYNYYSVSAFSDSLIIEAKNLVERGVQPENLMEQMEDISVRNYTTSNSSSPGFELVETLNPLEISEIQVSGVRHSFFFLNEIEEPRQMTFEEAFSRVANDFQPIHEARFIEYLKNEFGVETYPENIQL